MHGRSVLDDNFFAFKFYNVAFEELFSHTRLDGAVDSNVSVANVVFGLAATADNAVFFEKGPEF